MEEKGRNESSTATKFDEKQQEDYYRGERMTEITDSYQWRCYCFGGGLVVARYPYLIKTLRLTLNLFIYRLMSLCNFIILGEMHGIVGRAWCYDRWYVYTYH